MKTCTIIAGAHGTGRTSLLGALCALRTDLGCIIDCDFAPAVQSCPQNGADFTLKTTLSGAFAAQTVQRARRNGYTVHLYYVGLDSVEDALMRIASRVRKGGRAVPENEVRRTFSKRAESLSAVLPFCHDALFYDNENGFVPVAQYEDGALTCYPNVPRWMNELAAAVS